MKQFLKDNLDRVLAVAAMVLVVAFLAPNHKPAKADPINVGIFADPLTGCQYITNGTGIVPRLTKNGEHICTAPGDIKEN